MNKLLTAAATLLLVSLISCKKDNHSFSMTQFFKDQNYSPETIKAAKVKSRITYEIQTGNGEFLALVDLSNKELSARRIVLYEFFDKNGLCTLKVTPTYKQINNDTSGYSKLDALDQFFFKKYLETNQQTGYSDSILFLFDENQRLVQEDSRKTTKFGVNYTEYVRSIDYDQHGNIKQSCISNETSSQICVYSFNKYDKNGRLELTTDSIVGISHSDRVIYKKYSYAENGLLKSIQDKYFIYNEAGYVIEDYLLPGDTKQDHTFYTYDQNGNCVRKKIIPTYLASKSDTEVVLFFYDSKNLLYEEQYKLSVKSEDPYLKKYAYTFY